MNLRAIILMSSAVIMIILVTFFYRCAIKKSVYEIKTEYSRCIDSKFFEYKLDKDKYNTEKFLQIIEECTAVVI